MLRIFNVLQFDENFFSKTLFSIFMDKFHQLLTFYSQNVYFFKFFMIFFKLRDFESKPADFW